MHCSTRKCPVTSQDPPFFKSLLRDEDLQCGLDKAGIGIWDLDLSTRELYWSSATRRLFGVLQDDPISFDLFLSLLQPEDRVRTESAIERCIQTRGKLDIQYRVREGAKGRHWVRARGGLVNEDGVPRRLRGVVLDIDDQKLIEETLLAREDHLRSILDTIPDAMIVIDDHGIMQRFSAAAERLFGYSRIRSHWPKRQRSDA